MNFMSLNMDSCKRSCGAEVFTCSATDTSFLVHGRDSERFRIIRILSDHSDRSGWAVACAVSATDAIRVHDAVVKADHRMSDLDRRLFLDCDRTYSARRAYIRTFGTFRAAISAFI